MRALPEIQGLLLAGGEPSHAPLLKTMGMARLRRAVVAIFNMIFHLAELREKRLCDLRASARATTKKISLLFCKYIYAKHSGGC
jgi:hypothetical protein